MTERLQEGQIVGVVISECIYEPTMRVVMAKVKHHGRSTPNLVGDMGKFVLNSKLKSSGKVGVQYTFPEMHDHLDPDKFGNKG